jgi:hypothetical protein
LPDDLRQTLDDYRAAVIAAQGGLDVLDAEPVRAGLVRSLVSAETLERLALNGLIRAGGVETRAGARLYDRVLAAVDRKLRVSLALGLARRQRPVDPLEAVRLAVAAANAPEGGDA